MDLTSFIESLPASQPPVELPDPLKALWFDFTDDWERAHKAVHQENDRASAWVHAYLHRKEGDLWNARYWYRVAGKRPAVGAFDEERQQITAALLSELATPAINNSNRNKSLEASAKLFLHDETAQQ
jgi:hypothetical protein